MAFGPEVGSVTVRVMPDTRKFRATARRELRNAIKDEEFKTNVVPDVTAFRKQLEKVAKDITVEVDVKINRASVQRAHGELQRVMDRQQVDATVGLQLENTTRLLANVEALRRAIAARAAKLPVEPDVKSGRLRRSLEVIKVEVRQAQQSIMRPLDRAMIAAGVAFGGLGFAAARGVAALGSVARNVASGGLKMMNGALNAGAGLLSKLGSMIMSLGPQAIALAALIAALAPPALALISGALTAIPGVIAGLVAPMAAVALGAEGMKEALVASGLAMGEWKDGKLELKGIGQNLKNLQKIVSGTFRDNLVKPFQRLNDAVPQLHAQFETLAKGMSTAFGGVVDAVTSDAGLNNIQKVINNIGVAFDKATPGLRDFTNGLLHLAGKFSENFPDMGDSFSKMGSDFLAWVNKITTIDASGTSEFSRAMQTMRDTLGELVGIVRDLFASGWDNLSNPSFGESMSGFVSDIRSLVSDVLPSLADSFETIADAITTVREAIDAIPSIDSPDKNGKSPWDPFGWTTGDDIGKEGEKLGKELAAGVASGLDYGSKWGADVLVPKDVGTVVQQQIAGQIEAASAPTKEALQNTITANGIDENVANQLTQQVEAAISGAKDAVGRLGPDLQTKIDDSLKVLDGIGAKMGLAFAGLAPAVVAGMQPAINAIQSIATQMTQTLSSSLGGSMYNTIVTAFSGTAGAVTAGLAPALGAVASSVTAMLQAMQAGLAAVTAVVEASFSAVPAVITGQMAAAVGAVASSCQLIVSTMLSFTGAAQSAGHAIGASFAAGLSSAAGLVQASASSLLGMARAFFPNSPAKKGPFSGAGWIDKSGTAVGETFAKAMAATAGAVQEGATKMAAPAADAVAKARQDVEDQTAKLNQSIQAASQGGIKLGGVALGIKTGSAQEQQADLQVMRDAITLKEKEIALQKQLTSDPNLKAGFDAQLKELKLRKDNLAVQEDQLQTQDQMASSIDSAFNTMTKMPFDFASANLGQLASDMGMSGTGAIPSLMNEAMNIGSNFVFNVSGIGDALSAQGRIQSKQALAQR